MRSNHALTRRVDQAELLGQLRSAGVTAGIGIDGTHIRLNGANWRTMSKAERAKELAIVAAVEALHVPTTRTEVKLTKAPHVGRLLAECEIVAGKGVGAVLPDGGYPGIVVFNHRSLSEDTQRELKRVAKAHDPTAVPSLGLDIGDLQVLGNGSDRGKITITDSRGSGADGVVIDVVLPPQPIALDKVQITLDSSGQGVVTFGPSPAGGYVSGKIPLGFQYNDPSVIGDGVDATCQYT